MRKKCVAEFETIPDDAKYYIHLYCLWINAVIPPTDKAYNTKESRGYHVTAADSECPASPCDLLGLVWVSRNMVGRTVHLDLLLLSSHLLWRGSHCLGGGVCHHSLRTHTGGNLSALNFNKLLSAELATSCWNGQFSYHSCPLCAHTFVVLRVLLSWERTVSSVALVWPIFVLLSKYTNC